MKGATLRVRPFCGAAPRRYGPAAPRPGVYVRVIVPSRDNASGSSDERWALSSDRGGINSVLLKQLEAAFNREVSEPAYDNTNTATSIATATDPRPQLLGPQLQLADQQQDPQQILATAEAVASGDTEAVTGASLNGYHMPTAGCLQRPCGGDADYLSGIQVDPAALKERLASAAHASTSGQTAVANGHSSSLLLQQQQHLAYSNRVLPRGGGGVGGVGSVTAAATVAVPRAVAAGTVPAAPASGNGASTLVVNQQQHQLDDEQDVHLGSQGAPGQVSGHQEQQQHRQQQPVNNHPLALNSLLGAPEGEAAALASAASLPSLNSSSTSTSSGSAAQVPTHGSTQQQQPQQEQQQQQQSDAIPGSIWILCCISAALTCASCVFNTALPIYMVSELKMSMRSMGMFEGLLEAFSYVVRMCSGVVSDRMASRKAAISLGFAASAVAKLGMASAGSVGLLFTGKAVDRLANGIQAAPRDALIGDLSPPSVRSACFGLAQSLRKWGSAVGALAAFTLMKASNNNYQLIFYSAAAVSAAATAAFMLLVPAHTRSSMSSTTTTSSSGATAATAQQHAQHQHHSQQQKQAQPSAASASSSAGGGPMAGVAEFVHSLGAMGSDFYRMLGVICCYALGHVNESLLEARAMEVGFGKAEATLVVAALAGVTFLTAFPLGRLDDKYGAGTTFAVGIGSLIAGDLVLLLSGRHPLALFGACIFLGVHWAVIQGPLLSIVSGLAPSHLRGTAFGIFYTVMAVTAVAANTMYGNIWHTYGANAAFATSAGLMSLVLAALPRMLPASTQRGRGGVAVKTTSTTIVGAPLPAAA